jgi:ABC-type Zn uptake system ZnuABC Zn-binding protein ZnuA
MLRAGTSVAVGLLAVVGATRLAGAEADDVLVLTALPVTYSVAKALTKDTSVEVQNLPEGGRPMASQQSFFASQAERLSEQFARADAVITIGKLWQDDPFFVAARSANIRVVDIDATKPWSETLEGASIVLAPVEDAPWSKRSETNAPRMPSVYFWLSPSNGARIADIVAQDLMRLAPADAPQIQANLAAYRRTLLQLKREYEVKLAEVADVTVYALTADLVYLTTDMSIYVDGYFLEQDIRWTDADAAAFRQYLLDNGIRVVLHRWDPAAPIKAAIEAAGARLVVLDTGDTGIVEEGRLVDDGYVRLLRANLGALYEALSGANE